MKIQETITFSPSEMEIKIGEKNRTVSFKGSLQNRNFNLQIYCRQKLFDISALSETLSSVTQCKNMSK